MPILDIHANKRGGCSKASRDEAFSSQCSKQRLTGARGASSRTGWGANRWMCGALMDCAEVGVGE